MRKILKAYMLRLVLLLTSTAFALLLAETAVRFFLPQFIPSGSLVVRAVDSGMPPLGPRDTHIRHRKNTGDYDVEVHFNAYGLRDLKDLADSNPEDFVLAGDSFSMGWGVEASERFSNLLASTLEVPLYNIAAPSADITDYGKLIHYAQSNGLKAAHLIIGLCLENDLRLYSQNLSPRLRPKENEPSFIQRLNGLFHRTKRRLADHSALYFWMTATVHQNPNLRNWATRWGFITPNEAGLGRGRIPAEVLEASVTELTRVTQGFETVICLLIPSRGLWTGAHQAAERENHEHFLEALRAKGFAVVDPRAQMEAEGRPMDYHFKNDGHWNAQGHALAARVLWEFMVSPLQ